MDIEQLIQDMTEEGKSADDILVALQDSYKEYKFTPSELVSALYAGILSSTNAIAYTVASIGQTVGLPITPAEFAKSMVDVFSLSFEAQLAAQANPVAEAEIVEEADETTD